jgi:hypothetical protein
MAGGAADGKIIQGKIINRGLHGWRGYEHGKLQWNMTMPRTDLPAFDR